VVGKGRSDGGKEDKVQIVVKSLHQDEFHRIGTIDISGAKVGSGQPVGIRQMTSIITPRMGTFSETELGGVESGGYVECGAMAEYKKEKKNNKQIITAQKDKSQSIVRKNERQKKRWNQLSSRRTEQQEEWRRRQ
jgi:hypothetical protein